MFADKYSSIEVLDALNNVVIPGSPYQLAYYCISMLCTITPSIFYVL